MKSVVEPIEKYALKRDLSKSKPNIFKKLGLVGGGILSQEIARMASGQGMEVVLIETTKEKVKKALVGIENDLDRMIERWGMTEGEKKAILSRIEGFTDYRYLQDVDIIIEVLQKRSREDSVTLRKEVFRQIEEVVKEDIVIATNSTTLLITEFSSDLKHPERCLSLHFLSPAAETPLVEVVRGLHTSEETMEKANRFAKMMNKKVIPVVESPGIISTRLIAPLINEACAILMEGVGEMEDIDKTMKLGFGFPMGPFEMADKFGVDMVVRWLDNLYKEFGDLHYKASPILKKMVRGNRLGRETHHGFYSYDEEGSVIKNKDL